MGELFSLRLHQETHVRTGTHIVPLAHAGCQDSPAVVKDILPVGVALQVQRDAGAQLLRLCVPDQHMLREPALLLDLHHTAFYVGQISQIESHQGGSCSARHKICQS